MVLKSYGIHVTTASPTNHQSLMAEHGIKSLANILMKHLTGLGDNWPIYCKPAMLAYNSYATHNLRLPWEEKLFWPQGLNANLIFLVLVLMLKPIENCRKTSIFQEKIRRI